jgi:thioredoxin-like negative regulator of GroEL
MNMKVVMLYRPNSESARKVEEFAHDLEHQHQAKIELVSLDTRAGASAASLYGVMQNPAILVLGNDGRLIREWQGSNLPLKNEVSYYMHQ